MGNERWISRAALLEVTLGLLASTLSTLVTLCGLVSLAVLLLLTRP